MTTRRCRTVDCHHEAFCRGLCTDCYEYFRVAVCAPADRAETERLISAVRRSRPR